MHLMYVHQHFTTPEGIVGIRSYQMAKAAVENGHEVTMICGSYNGGNTGLNIEYKSGKRQGMVENINVVEFDLSYSNKDGFLKRVITFSRFALGASQYALFAKYDIFFATTTPLTAGIPGIVARWLRRKTFVFEVRDLWPELPREMGVITNPLVLWGLSALEWASYRSANRCVALSPGIVKGIERRGVSPEKIVLIPNGCDLEIFSSLENTNWRPDGVRATDLMAVYTGTHGQANGLEAVLDAASILQARGRDDIKLVLIGDGKLKTSLKARAQSEGLTNVIFHQPVAKEKLAGLMAAADLGMQCLANIPAFYYGTSPNKFFDYIAAGLPVLNNYPGWLADMITAEDCGFAVPPDDPAAFARALEQAGDDRKALQAKGKNAKVLAKRDFNRADLADKWVAWVTGVGLNETVD